MVKLSEKASEDLDAILEYSLVNFGVDVMQTYYESLEDCFDTLDKNPSLGINAEHIFPGYFCFYHRSHIIFYQQDEMGIFIVRLLHKSMDVPQHFNV